jgi:hypothetical protein
LRSATSSERARSLLSKRLRARAGEIERAILSRLEAIAALGSNADPGYVEGLRQAVSTALEYGLLAIEASEDDAPSVPVALLSQARLAARNGVSLETVVRRYLAGYTLLGDFLLEEAGANGLLAEAELKRMLRAQAAVFDQVLMAVGEEHARELERRCGTAEERRAERIERLLAGELLETTSLAYDFNCWHLGLIATGRGAQETLIRLAGDLDRRLLSVCREDGAVWAWLGSRRTLESAEVARFVARSRSTPIFAIGEPARGPHGWRLTHRQARAAMPIALRRNDAAVRYADVALLAATRQDDLAMRSLLDLYIAPLEGDRERAAAAKQTLRAYFAAERKVSSAAAALGVDRHTVSSRLRAIEEKLCRSITSSAAALEVALQLDALEDRSELEEGGQG